MSTASAIAAAVAERDRILVAFDVEAARAFVAKHGGRVPKKIDWEAVLHLARFECTTIEASHNDLWWESRIWLARNGKRGVTAMPPNSPYVRTALDLVFPKDLTGAWMVEHAAAADGSPS